MLERKPDYFVIAVHNTSNNISYTYIMEVQKFNKTKTKCLQQKHGSCFMSPCIYFNIFDSANQNYQLF